MRRECLQFEQWSRREGCFAHLLGSRWERRRRQCCDLGPCLVAALVPVAVLVQVHHHWLVTSLRHLEGAGWVGVVGRRSMGSQLQGLWVLEVLVLVLLVQQFGFAILLGMELRTEFLNPLRDQQQGSRQVEELEKMRYLRLLDPLRSVLPSHLQFRLLDLGLNLQKLVSMGLICLGLDRLGSGLVISGPRSSDWLLVDLPELGLLGHFLLHLVLQTWLEYGFGQGLATEQLKPEQRSLQRLGHSESELAQPSQQPVLKHVVDQRRRRNDHWTGQNHRPPIPDAKTARHEVRADRSSSVGVQLQLENSTRCK